MKTFNYVITDPVGIHARPASLLVKMAKNYESDLTIEKDGKTASLTKLMSIMQLGIKKGDTVTISANGEDENTAIEELKNFFEENL